MSNGGPPGGSFPQNVSVEIVRHGQSIAVQDQNATGNQPLESILVHYGGQITWTSAIGPWKVVRKMDGPNPFQGMDGIGGDAGETKTTPMCAASRRIVNCGFSVAVWDAAANNGDGELHLIDPDIVVGPPA